MAVTIKRPAFVGAWLSIQEHMDVVQAAQDLDPSLAASLREAATEKAVLTARRRARRDVAPALQRAREQGAALATVEVLRRELVAAT